MLDDPDPVADRLYPYRRSRDQSAPGPVRHPVVVVGAGPVGLVTALDLALHEVPVLLLDDQEGPGRGSRAICFSKRSLEIADRLGCAAPMLEKGVVWSTGRVYHGEREVYAFDLLPESGHKFPAFINLQQPYFERFLVERIRDAQRAGAPIELRGRNRVQAVASDAEGATLDVTTPEGTYPLRADWLLACDGASSPLRRMLGQGFEGRVFEDSFLIADVRMNADFPVERRFWFDPPFRSGASALLHRQPDDIWRIDFQIGWDVDREEELREENVRARIDRMLGGAVPYEIVWSSVYTFQCRRMTRFRHGRVVFLGDAAHQVSPFGARGANSGVQDADNLGWKLAMVLRGEAPESLIDSFDAERVQGADENILASTRSTDFITPKSPASRLFRDAVLDLSAHHAFARPLVNSGRLSVPCTYDGSRLSGPDALPDGPARTRPGSPCPDAPLGDGFLLERLGGGFALLALGETSPSTANRIELLVVPADAVSPELRERYLGAAPGAVYLIRPDQHVAARWDRSSREEIEGALRRATGREEG